MGRRHRLLSLRPRRGAHALCLRHTHPDDPTGRGQRRRLRHPVRLSGPGRDRLRPVWRAPSLRSRLLPDAPGRGDPRRGPAAAAPAFREAAEQADSARRALPFRQARALRSPRRDPGRARGERRRAQSDAQPRGGRSRSCVVARRQVGGLVLGRERGICAAPACPGRPRPGPQDRPGRAAVLLLFAPLVAGQQEDRLHGQAPEPVAAGPGPAHAREARHRPLRHAVSLPRPGLVGGQPLDRVHQAAPQPPARRLRVLAGREEEPPGHRRPQRRDIAALRPGRQVPLLPRPPRARGCPRAGWT